MLPVAVAVAVADALAVAVAVADAELVAVLVAEDRSTRGSNPCDHMYLCSALILASRF